MARRVDRGSGLWLFGLCLPFAVAFGVTATSADVLIGIHHPLPLPTTAGRDGTSAAMRVALLAGVWTAPQDRTERMTDLDLNVFGPHAFDVRDVVVTIQRSGDAALRVSTAVVDRKGKRRAPSVIEAKLQIGPLKTSMPGRIQPVVTVLSAEERYLDGANDRWPMDGLRVTMSMTDPAAGEMNFRFDTKEGRGSFGTTLMRQTLVR